MVFHKNWTNNSVVDNGHHGGILALIDIQTGIVFTQAISVKGELYKYHPQTKEAIVGIKIPYWDRLLKAAELAARFYPSAKIVGWDFAVCENGIIELIEGNSKPDLDMIQAANGKGMKKFFYDMTQ